MKIKHTFVVGLVALASMSGAFAEQYTYTVDFINELNVPIDVQDNNKFVASIPANTSKTLTFKDNGDQVAVYVNGKRQCAHEDKYNEFDLVSLLRSGFTKYHARLSGHVAAHDSIIRCMVNFSV